MRQNSSILASSNFMLRQSSARRLACFRSEYVDHPSSTLGSGDVALVLSGDGSECSGGLKTHESGWAGVNNSEVSERGVGG